MLRTGYRDKRAEAETKKDTVVPWTRVGVGQREGRVERARREPAMPRQPAVLTLISVCSLPHPACCLYLLHPSVPTPVL